MDKKIEPRNVIYFSFDEISYDVRDVLDAYQNFILGETFEKVKERVYLSLDEIQKIEDWENKLKTYYDLYPNLRIIVSGSSSIKLRKREKRAWQAGCLPLLYCP